MRFWSVLTWISLLKLTLTISCRVFYEEVVYWRWRTVLQYCASWVLSMPFYIAFLTYFGSLVLKQIKGHQRLWKRNLNLLFHKAFEIVPRLGSVSFKIFTKVLKPFQTEVDSRYSKETSLVIYLAFLAKVAIYHYIILTAFKKYWPDTVAKFISGTQETFI